MKATNDAKQVCTKQLPPTTLFKLYRKKKKVLSFRRDSSQIDSIAFQDYIPLYFFENELVLISVLPGVICSFEIKSFHISEGKGLLFYFLLNVFDIFEQLT